MQHCELSDSEYLSLGTWRKSGKFVPTPVWFAPGGDYLYVFSAGDAGKIKRLRNSARARVAPCTVTGRLLGDWQEATAVVLDDPQEVAVAYQALHARYRWRMVAIDLISRLAGRFKQRKLIRIAVERPPGAAGSRAT